MPDEETTVGSPARTCPKCGVASATDGAHCPECGALYASQPRMSATSGCLAVFGGILAGAVVFFLVFAAIGTFGARSDDVALAILVGADLAAVVGAIVVVVRGRHGIRPLSLFAIGLLLTVAGLLSTCALFLAAFQGTKF